MQSADDYDFDDPRYQADLDSLLDRLFKRRHADRSRHADHLTRMMDIISDPFKRIEEPVEQIEKPVPEELPAASTVEELRANLGKRKGTRSGRKVQHLSYEPTLDLELIESMCSEPSVQRRLKEARLKEQAAEQQAEEVKVRELRARGWGWKKIAAELHASRDRLRSMYGQPSTSS